METKEKIRISSNNEEKFEEPKDFLCIIKNDNYTTFEFVIYILKEIFHKSDHEAIELTEEVHKEGQAVAGKYSYDIAYTKCTECLFLAKMEEFPLRLILQEDY
jgi:ATP-dependent Clp protease adaptor protein ClpS